MVGLLLKTTKRVGAWLDPPSTSLARGVVLAYLPQYVIMFVPSVWVWEMKVQATDSCCCCWWRNEVGMQHSRLNHHQVSFGCWTGGWIVIINDHLTSHARFVPCGGSAYRVPLYCSSTTGAYRHYPHFFNWYLSNKRQRKTSQRERSTCAWEPWGFLLRAHHYHWCWEELPKDWNRCVRTCATFVLLCKSFCPGFQRFPVPHRLLSRWFNCISILDKIKMVCQSLTTEANVSENA